MLCICWVVAPVAQFLSVILIQNKTNKGAENGTRGILRVIGTNLREMKNSPSSLTKK